MLTASFTTTGIWTVPSGVFNIEIECWGAGASGGNVLTQNAAGGGGGGGGYSRSYSVSVTPGATHMCQVGIPSDPDTSDLGTSAFFAAGASTTQICSANGGHPGLGSLGGGGARAGTGDLTTGGGDGGNGTTAFNIFGAGGGGAGGSVSNGFNGGDAAVGVTAAGGTSGGPNSGQGGNGSGTSAAQSGFLYGGGGGGGNEPHVQVGGVGAPGYVFLVYDVSYPSEQIRFVSPSGGVIYGGSYY